ncbi:MAG: sigma-70 family RNA polymerase sigma factor [Chloroflexota bacterium]
MEDELSLVQRAKQRDEAAFAKIYESYFDKIYRYLVLKIGDRTEAEDLTQQVFLKVVQKIGSFNWRGTPFSAWLFRIAHNQMVDYLRQRNKRHSLPLNESIPSQDDPQRTVEIRLDMERVFEAAKKLTAAQQEVISLRFSADLSTSEVARIMNKSEGAIKALQHSAIIALRKILATGVNR